MSKRQRLWLCLPPWAACTLDQLLTLWGQPTHYWDVSYDYALEASPPFNWLLRQHPLAFEAGIAAWVLLFTAVIVVLPLRLARATSLAIVIGHGWGASTWLTIRISHGYWLAIALFIAAGLLTSCCWERAER